MNTESNQGAEATLSTADAVVNYRLALEAAGMAQTALNLSAEYQRLKEAQVCLEEAKRALLEAYGVQEPPGNTTKLDDVVSVKRSVTYKVPDTADAREFLANAQISPDFVLQPEYKFSKSGLNNLYKVSTSASRAVLDEFYENFVEEKLGPVNIELKD